MPAARARRPGVGAVRRRPRAAAKAHAYSGRLRRIAASALVVSAVLLTLLAALRALHPGAAGASVIRYTAVTGDTASSVASLFALDPISVAREAGTAGGDPLAAGQQIAVDPSRLWRAVGQGNLAPVESLIAGTARRMGVEPALALAVAWQESRLDQGARSPTGAIGIMQVEPDTGRLAARDLGRPLDITRASDNVTAGVFWLRSLLTSFGGQRSAALAAYYEGPGNLAREGYLDGTSAYVAHGLALREALLSADGSLG